jgi:pyruvate-formate lyase-activating enzyme
VATFLSPAHTGNDLVAYRTTEGVPALPTYAYTAAGFADDRYWASAIRVDPDIRQEPWRFPDPDIRRGVEDRGRELPGNQVVEQLERCALEYKCRAAQNYFLARHEAPLPVSVACNAQCVGCISLQPDGTFRASHERLMTAPTPDALADLALGHLERVPDGVVSFGQGCEGEPLLVGEVLIAATRRIRERTGRGTINLNTNASKPEVVRELVAAGLDSIRASLNSPRSGVYRAYYQPRGYGVDEVVESLRIVHEGGGHTSINLLYFPGVTDTEDERRALAELIDTTGLDLVQMRNLNIDPELYRQIIPSGTVSRGRGVRWLLAELSEQFPELRFGYFNPPLTSPSRGWTADDERP